ncbi:LOW QUALITY PROTEIN: epidermal growth factor receptor kinase substrate 8 [Dunckerocampus dactyliophorus]|uniref:LOW QUALITY PROTEIN: epidermal growth factor receptor kinase substrate 8 n=1 Tax=Dunckerocampus dactyliophorus TaxID=161453 RepID=UPI00240574D6|nr:LOW QUALITY PROTEIN: epidermal growth factor receptor kinase substrate 8 [Dunckerocampus dactyliophorus]
MYRSDSPLGNDTSSYSGSIQSSGYSATDEASSQVSCMSRPSAKSIYLQRKAYAASMNKTINYFHYRVEHLLTCELDGTELRGLPDCVERLNLLDRMGRVWGQNMLLEVNGPHLLLTDTESKEVLESINLCDAVELKAILDTSASNSLLALTVKASRKQAASVFLFHCEDVRADYVQKGLSQARLSASHEAADRRSHVKAEEKAPQWAPPDYNDDGVSDTDLVTPHEDVEEVHPPRLYTELDRNVDILNHIVNDIEIFMGKVAAIATKNAKKKNKKMKKGKAGMPPAGEFAACLHKIKCGFNLLVELKGKIQNPDVSEFVHSLFSVLSFLASHCSKELPPSIVAPLLTPQCICLMSEEATAEEDQLWQSLGDAWNIPSTKWPEDDEDIPTYTLEFSDGWQPPELREEPAPTPAPPVARAQEARRPPSGQTTTKKTAAPPAALATHAARTHARPREKKLRRVRVLHDFSARNHRELTIRKGEVVELLDVTKMWWKVRNSGGEEGFVPSNVLTADEEQADDTVTLIPAPPDLKARPQLRSPLEGCISWPRRNPLSLPFQPTGSSPVLSKKSKPAEVKAWLEHVGFTKITVRCLGVLSGSMLLSMTREELKTVCPEEGGRVFFRLQAVRSSILADAD